MALDFPTRVAVITQGITRFLRQYRQPEHLTDETALAVVRTIAEAVNARISSSLSREGLAEMVDKMCREVAVSYRGKDWPNAANFVAAIPKRDPAQAVEGEWKLRPVSVMAKRIMAGEPVGDGWIWGALAVDLLRQGEISDGDLEPYRRAHAAKLRETYGAQVAERMLADLEIRHERAQGIFCSEAAR